MPFLYTYTYTYTHTSPTAESCMYPVRRLSYTNPRSSNSTQIKGKLQCAMLKSHKNVTDYLAFETYLMRMRDIWGRGRPKSILIQGRGRIYTRFCIYMEMKTMANIGMANLDNSKPREMWSVTPIVRVGEREVQDKKKKGVCLNLHDGQCASCAFGLHACACAPA